MADRFPIIALACSAGGLEALSQVLGPLPPDLPAALIALQHHGPGTPSVLPQILARRTALTVAPATEGAPLQPGHVLVAPPGHHILTTTQGTVALIPAAGRPLYQPSADLLFTSLAITAGPRAIAVVLSGWGHDAATGATAIHHMGGLVIASEPVTAKAAAMPQATINREDITDQIAPADSIAALLTRLLPALA